jgi:hypothetical protein
MQTGWLATGGRGGLPLPPQPALQRPHAGQVGRLGIEQVQVQPQVGGAPTRMLLVQEQGLLDPRRRRRRGGVVVTRPDRTGVGTQAGAEGADRPFGKAQFARDGGRGRALLQLMQDTLPRREWNRCRHGNLRLPKGAGTIVWGKNSRPPCRRQNLVSLFPAEPDVA